MCVCVCVCVCVYMEELYKTDLNELDYDGSRPKPDILECDVKWALRSAAVNKASDCDEIVAELFKSQRRMPSRFCIHYVSKSVRPTVATGLEKVSPHPSS